MYSKAITRASRSAFLLVLDISGSTMDVIECKRRGVVTKSQILVESCNKILAELYFRATREGQVRNYYDIGVIAYSGSSIYSMLNSDIENPFVGVDRLRNNESGEWVKLKLLSNFSSMESIMKCDDSTILVAPNGRTPMYEALYYTNEAIKRWCARPESLDSYPPTVIHLTDGHSTDCNIESIRYISQNIMDNRVKDGKTLLFNILLDPRRSRELTFPTDEEVEEYRSPLLTTMALSSSKIPERYMRVVNTLRKEPTNEDCRGFGVASSVSQIATMMSIGTEVAMKRRAVIKV